LYQLIRRYCREHLFSKQDFALKYEQPWQTQYQISTQQEIKINQYFDNKTHNIDLTIQALHGLVIEPNQIFSFWHFVPAPTQRNGYKIGRNLVQGKIIEDIGGGICQISCLLYINALKTGLRIIERHAHSVDIYQEHERFTPLGSDATVVYGYKDLQFQNTLDFPIQIKILRQNNKLLVLFVTKRPTRTYLLDFIIEDFEHYRSVNTYADHKHIAKDKYQLLSHFD
ncbi:MAG: VanW family protein, partial [Acinetobacter sp.]